MRRNSQLEDGFPTSRSERCAPRALRALGESEAPSREINVVAKLDVIRPNYRETGYFAKLAVSFFCAEMALGFTRSPFVRIIKKTESNVNGIEH